MVFSLSFSIHTFYGLSWQIEAQGETLSWSNSLDGYVIEEKTMILTQEIILSFIRECEELGVFAWEPHYMHCCMLDGASWSVTMRLDDRVIRSVGTNGYPENWAGFCNSVTKFAQLDTNPCTTTVSPVDKFRKA